MKVQWYIYVCIIVCVYACSAYKICETEWENDNDDDDDDEENTVRTHWNIRKNFIFIFS